MNAEAITSRLLCDHCHGHGYEDTAAGKVACGECNQESSEVVSNHQEMSGEPTIKEYLTTAATIKDSKIVGEVPQ